MSRLSQASHLSQMSRPNALSHGTRLGNVPWDTASERTRQLSLKFQTRNYAMSKPEKKSSNPEAIKVQDPATLPGKDKDIGGSKSDDWNLVIANHVVNSLRPIADEEQRDQALLPLCRD